MAIGSGVLLPAVAKNPTFPILSALAYTTGLGYRPTCDSVVPSWVRCPVLRSYCPCRTSINVLSGTRDASPACSARLHHTNHSIIIIIIHHQSINQLLSQTADTESRRRLRYASSTSLDVRHTRLSTVGDRAFPVTAARLWNSLPSHVTAAPSLSIFCCRLKSHLFSFSYPAFWLLILSFVVRAQWLVILDIINVISFNNYIKHLTSIRHYFNAA